MAFIRSYMNWEEGYGVCCWESPSKDQLEALFMKAGTPFTSIIAVEEHAADSLTT